MTTLDLSTPRTLASVHASIAIDRYLFQRPSDAALAVRGYAMYSPLLPGGEDEPECLPSIGLFMSRNMGQACQLRDMNIDRSALS